MFRWTNVVSRYRVGVARLITGIVLLLVWEILALASPFFVSGPLDVLAELGQWAGDGSLWSNSAATVREVVLGFAAGTVAGGFLGWLFASVSILDKATRPYIDVANAIPRIGLAPLFVLFFGLGLWSKVTLVFSVVIFVVLINTYSAIKSIEREHVLLAQSLGGTGWDVFAKVTWPASMPWLIAGLRLSSSYAISAAVVGEFIAANEGLGYLLAYRSAIFDVRGTWAALVALGILAAISTVSIMLIERRVLHWRLVEEGEMAFIRAEGGM